MIENEWSPAPPKRVLRLLVSFLVAYLMLVLLNILVPASFTRLMKDTFGRTLVPTTEYAVCYTAVVLIYNKWMRPSTDSDSRGK